MSKTKIVIIAGSMLAFGAAVYLTRGYWLPLFSVATKTQKENRQVTFTKQ